ncbi:MAG: hypothetical protein C0391_00920, partial [Anaerolinea sp.]|nr:hypothetical protein [Anaerolinea sp.]
ANAYQFRYDESTGFASPAYLTSESTPLTLLTHKPTPDMPLGTWYWQVRARDAAGNWGAWPTTYRTITILPPIPVAPVLTSPVNGFSTSDNTPDFLWNPVSYGANYEIQIDNLATFTAPIDQSSFTSNTTYTATTLNPGIYYWRVRAFNSASTPEAGAWSTIRSFTITADWTFMVYLAADNDLESFGILDFLEMAQVGSTSKMNIIVQMDRHASHDTSYDNWTSTKRFKVSSGMTPIAANALMDIGEADMGSQTTLINFINWSKTNYPAQRYALVIWNHGGSWYPMEINGEVISQSIAWDDTGTYLSNTAVYNALSSVTTGGINKLDLVALDACIMANIEIDYNMQNFVLARVASQANIPGEGFPYHTILNDLKNNTGMNQETLATAIVNRYAEYYSSNNVTISALRFQPTTPLATDVDYLARIMARDLATYYSAIDDAFWATMYFSDSAPAYDNIDLYGFASNLKARVPSGTDIYNAANAVMSRIDSMVFANRYDTTEWAGIVKGITIYFPWNASNWSAFRANYTLYQRFATYTYWNEFLDIYY